MAESAQRSREIALIYTAALAILLMGIALVLARRRTAASAPPSAATP